MNRELYEYRARVIKSLAHPTRLAIVDALAKGEICVCELQEIAGSDISTISKHLAVLKAAGVVTDRKEGLRVFYRLQVPCIMRFFDCVDAVIKHTAETQSNLAALVR